MEDFDYSEHFQAAAKVVEERAEDQDTLIESITDRHWDEIDLGDRTLRKYLEKFEISSIDLDVDEDELAQLFAEHDYNVYRKRDRRFKNEVNPERLIVVLTGTAEPVTIDALYEIIGPDLSTETGDEREEVEAYVDELDLGGWELAYVSEEKIFWLGHDGGDRPPKTFTLELTPYGWNGKRCNRPSVVHNETDLQDALDRVAERLREEPVSGSRDTNSSEQDT